KGSPPRAGEGRRRRLVLPSHPASAGNAGKAPGAGVEAAFGARRALRAGRHRRCEAAPGRTDVTEVAVVPDVAAATTELFVEAVAGASAARGRAAVALTGGSSAPPLFTRLLGAKLPWAQTDIFFTDERADDELVRHVAAPFKVEPKIARITLLPFLVVTARMVVLQVTGAEKADVLARALKGPEDLAACPAQWLRKASGRVVVACDGR